MRKILIMSLLLVQLAATAFAYTNKEDGFKTLSPSGDNYIAAEGKHFYGFIEDGGSNAGFAEVLTQEQADKFFGSPFSTDLFGKKYNDILLLQRNLISQEQIKKLVADVFVSPLFALADGEEPDYRVEVQKIGGNKYIVVKYLTGDNNSQSLYFTSGNDKLYMLMSRQQSFKQQALPESTIGVIGSADGQTEIRVQDTVPGEKFLKKFRTIKPQPQSRPLAFADEAAGVNVSLPDDWFYLQLKDNYNDEAICLTAAMPLAAMREIGAEALDLGVSDLDSAITAAKDAGAEMSEAALEEAHKNYYDIFRHGILLGSVKMADSRWTDEFLANPNQTALETRQAIEELKTYLAQYQRDIKSFTYDVNIADGQGSFYVQTELSPLDTDFYYRVFAQGKVVDKAAIVALVFDSTDADGESMAYKFWNNKVTD